MLFFLMAYFGCVTKKIMQAQKRTNNPFKNETQEDFKHFKKYFGTNHSNYETQERDKERRELIFSNLAIDR
jgi:hypothetical protein